MAVLNKILIAADMFVESHQCFVTAKCDIDYITSLLLSGAVVGIVGETLRDQGGVSTHRSLADLTNFVSETGTPKIPDGAFRMVYNALKHAGDKRNDIRASDDLEIYADLPDEAARMLDAAKADFNRIEISAEIASSLNPCFKELCLIRGSYISLLPATGC